MKCEIDETATAQNSLALPQTLQPKLANDKTTGANMSIMEKKTQTDKTPTLVPRNDHHETHAHFLDLKSFQPAEIQVEYRSKLVGGFVWTRLV